MEFQAASVSADLPDHRIAVLHGMLVDRIAHVAQESPRLYMLKADLHALLGDLDQALSLFRYIADHEHAGRIGKVAVQDGGAVHVDDVAVLQDDLLIRNAVADFIINGRADALGEALIVKGGGNASHLHSGLIDDVVDILGGHAGADGLCHLVQAGDIDDRALFDPFDLGRGLDDAPVRNHMAHEFVVSDLLIKIHMAGLVLLSASAPAGCVAFDLLIGNHSVFLLSCILINGPSCPLKASYKYVFFPE